MHVIRTALPSDALRLSQLAEGTFRETFAAANSPGNMTVHCAASYGEGIQSAEIAHPMMVTLLAESGGQLVGLAQLRWGDAPTCVGGASPGEIQRIYVASQWHGKGIAQSLMNGCLEALRARGSDVVWLGVWERNPRAIAFYRKIGFVECGSHVFPVGDDPQRDIVMARALLPA